MHRGISPLGLLKPPLAHRHILIWKNHVKANIARFAAGIMCVAAVIANFAVKSSICGNKNFLSQKQVYHFFGGFSMAKIHFFQ